MSDFFDSRSSTARKRYRCGDCGRAIEPGETYYRLAGVWEGDFWADEECRHCMAFRRTYDLDVYVGLVEDAMTAYQEAPGYRTITYLRALVALRNRWQHPTAGRLVTMDEARLDGCEFIDSDRDDEEPTCITHNAAKSECRRANR